MNHIVDLIKKSRSCIAVIEGRNPNVYYELGYAHAMGKKTILVSSAANAFNVPFDMQSKDIIFFNNHSGLKKELTDRIQKILI